MINSTDITPKQFILLDWNVIKYLKKPRKLSDEEFYNLVWQIRKRYEIHFCEAHLRDLAKSYLESNENLVNEDLFFLQKLSNNIALGIVEKTNTFHLVELSPNQLFLKKLGKIRKNRTLLQK